VLAHLRIILLSFIRLLLLSFITLSTTAKLSYAFEPPAPYLQDKTNDKASTDNQLSNVKKDIASQQTEIVEVSKKRLELNKQLKRDDLAISTVAKAIKNTDELLTKIEDKLSALNKEQQALKKEKKAQEAILAKQLRTAYSSGNHDYLKLLLNQEAAAKVERTLTYYQYLNNARIEEIDQFKVTLAAIQKVEDEQKVQAAELNKRIINIGSHASDFTYLHQYAVEKRALREANNHLFIAGKKTTCLNFGYFDTERSAHKDVDKMPLEYIIEIIEWTLNQKYNVKELTVCA